MVSVEPTVGVPVRAGWPTAIGVCAIAVADTTRTWRGDRLDVAGLVLGLGLERDDRVRRGAGRDVVAELEREGALGRHERVVGVQAHLLDVPALVVALDLEVDRVDRGDLLELERVGELGDRRGRVGRRRQQVAERLGDERVARRLVDLLEAEAERDRVTRGDRDAAGGRLGRRRLESSSAFSWRSGCCSDGLESTLVNVRRRVIDFARGVGLPSASCVGSLPAAVSTVNGATPAKIESAVGAIGAAL